VLLDEQGRVLARLGKFLGRQTNNVAEYQGLLLGLARAKALGARAVEVRADSLLLVKQLQGEYAVKNAALKELHARARTLLREFEQVDIRHVPREENALADEMSNRAIDERLDGDG
jgi:ribonuclease HI